MHSVLTDMWLMLAPLNGCGGPRRIPRQFRLVWRRGCS
jgi:hypothetical protein